MRKFLINQSEKMLLTHHPFKKMGITTKKLFDDTYIYLSEGGGAQINSSDNEEDQDQAIKRQHNYSAR